MRAMVLEAPAPVAEAPLVPRELPLPAPGPGQVRLRVLANGVCRTDLHVVEGELPDPKLPLVPGHQIVGAVEALGEGVEGVSAGDRLGVPWLGWACGECSWCLSGRENLCPRARFTGYQLDGGYAEHAVAEASFTFPIPADFPDLQAAPLLCAGLIGYRALRLAGAEANGGHGLPERGGRLGLYGFGASAHIVIQVALDRGHEVLAFTRGEAGQAFARELGATWAGGGEDSPPEPLDAAIVFAPAGELVPAALRALAPGGVCVCAGIHMSDIPSFPYEILWRERVVRSVANLTRRDGREFLALAPRVPVRTEVETWPLEQANEALQRLKLGDVRGAAVLVP